MNTDENLMWKEQSSRDLFKTAVFTVPERTSTGPDGQTGKYIVANAPDWVIVIPEEKDSFLMVKQWRHGSKCLSVEFPGGVIDSGEEPEVAARRELLEETGCRAGKLTKLGQVNPNPALFSNHVHIFLAQELECTGGQSLDEDEFVNVIKVQVEQIIADMGTEQFPHALMSTALLYYVKNSPGDPSTSSGTTRG